MVLPKRAVSLTIQYEEFATLPQPDYEGSERLYQEWKASQVKETCSCVLAVKRLTGFTQSVGYAKNWPRNTDTPQVGGVVITNESSSGTYKTGHVAYISVIQDDVITLDEWNYVRCKHTTRTIKVGDKRIIGFWKPI